MLWVEIDLRRESSKVWREEGLDALEKNKVFNYTVFFQKAIYLSTLLKG
ncbi:hypothetical protein PAENIP36_67150 [Paenibacillus sp. P36]